MTDSQCLPPIKVTAYGLPFLIADLFGLYGDEGHAVGMRYVGAGIIRLVPQGFTEAAWPRMHLRREAE